jgi:hypothetical protein
MALLDLREALRTARLDAEIIGEFVVFPFTIPTGAHAGETVRIGLTGTDFPINPPGGVHVCPRLLHPAGSADHASGLGPDWVYWSRPFPDWATSARSVGDYLAFLRQLFGQIAGAAA